MFGKRKIIEKEDNLEDLIELTKIQTTVNILTTVVKNIWESYKDYQDLDIRKFLTDETVKLLCQFLKR